MDFIFHFLALHCPKVTPKTVAAAIGVIGAWILFSQAGAVVLFHFLALHSPEVAPKTVTAAVGVIGTRILLSQAGAVILFHFLALHSPEVAPKTITAAVGVIGTRILFSQAGAVVLSWFEFAHFGLLVAHTSLTALTIQAVAIYSHAVFLRNARCIILLIAFVMAGAITAILIRLAVGIYLAGCVAVLHHGGVWVLLACHFVR